jgi:type IV secretory pathway TrbD component
MATYHSAVLTLISLVLFSITGLLMVAGSPRTEAIGTGVVAALVIVGHALFVRASESTPEATE